MSDTDSKPPRHSVLDYPEPRTEGKTEQQAMARAAIDPAVNSMAVVKDFCMLPQEQVHNTELMAEIMKECQRVKGGDLGGIEAMLTAQAYSLDSIFQNLALRSKRNMGEYTKTADLYMKLALRAQSQCRATAEALALLKNPQPYIRQANIGQAVQVNNGQAADFRSNTRTPAQAREISPQTNELISGGQHAAVDYRGASKAGRADPQMAALEAGNRRKV